MKDNIPLVNVFMPVYNQEKYLEDSLNSIISQSYKNIKIVFSDDGSRDKTPLIAKQFYKKHKEYFSFFRIGKKNLGIKKHLNLLMKECTGDYILLFSGDDIAYIDKIKFQVEWLENHKEFSMHCHNVDFIDSNSRIICTDNQTERTITLFAFITSLNPPSSCSFIVRNNFVKKNTLNLSYNEDLDYKIRNMAKHGKLYCSKKVLGAYRIHSESLSSKINYIQLIFDYLKIIFYNLTRGKLKIFLFVTIQLTKKIIFKRKKPCYYDKRYNK